MRIGIVLQPRVFEDHLIPAACSDDPDILARTMLDLGRTVFPELDVSSASVRKVSIHPDTGDVDRILSLGSANHESFRNHDQSHAGTLPGLRRAKTNAPQYGSERGAQNAGESPEFARVFDIPHWHTASIELVLESENFGADPDVRRKADTFFVPFYIAALRTFGVIDTTTLSEWANMISCLTPSGLTVVRDIVASPRFRMTATAERLGLNKRTVENHVQNISKTIEARLPAAAQQDGYGSRLCDLINTFYFLRFTGRPLAAPAPELRELAASTA